MKNFAITGVAGYIAPRHLKAIKDTKSNLVAALDPFDSVGLLDSYFPEASFFTEFERFDRHLERLKRENNKKNIDYLSICSPNHLHDAHIRLALRLGSDAICEKPLVLNPWNLDSLQRLEEETGQKVYNILQLRVHPSLIKLKEKINFNNGKKHDVILTYITSRGVWYNYSWKGDLAKSGGLATNIGIHFFDLLLWLFGNLEKSSVLMSKTNKMCGHLELKDANVKWYLSIDKNDLPEEYYMQNKKTYRSIMIDGNELEFTDGFTDLHTIVYNEILNGNGFGISEARQSIETAFSIRNSKVIQNSDLIHRILKQKLLILK